MDSPTSSSDRDGVCVIDDQPYLLMPACDVRKAATLLRGIEAPLDAAVPVVDPGVLDSYVTVQKAADTFLWDLDRWLSDRSCQ